MRFLNNHKVRNFHIGDLVYDEMYGTGIVIDICVQMCDMEIRFRHPEKIILMNTESIDMLTIISEAAYRKPHNLR
jgi:hypothetical protein